MADPRISFARNYSYGHTDPAKGSGYWIVRYLGHSAIVHQGPFFERRLRRAARKLVERHSYLRRLETGDLGRQTVQERKQSRTDLEALLDELR